MKKMLYAVSAIFILLVAVVIIRAVSQRQSPKKELTVHNAVFGVDVADTDMSRMLGLSGRKNLGDNEGMLFIFPIPGEYSFWMKGMNFPLDFVWISNGSVIQVNENVPTPTSTLDFKTYSPSAPVDQVLEVNAGTILRTGIQVGDSVTLK
jgi:uncharacterized membrane protein (UPF0127 family)